MLKAVHSIMSTMLLRIVVEGLSIIDRSVCNSSRISLWTARNLSSIAAPSFAETFLEMASTRAVIDVWFRAGEEEGGCWEGWEDVKREEAGVAWVSMSRRKP